MRRKQLSFEVSDETFKKLETAAQMTERKKSDIMREAVKEKIDQILIKHQKSAEQTN